MVVGVMLTSVAGHLPPQHLPGRVPTHSGVAGGGASVAGDILDPHPPHPGWSQPPPLVLTNWPFCVAPLWSATLAEATSRSYLPQHHVSGSPLGRVLSLWQIHPKPLPHGTGWLGPFLSGTSLVWNYPGHPLVLEEINVYLSSSAGVYLGTFWSGLWFLTAWGHLGTFLSLSQGPGSPMAGGILMAGGVQAACGASMAGAAAHPLHLLLQNCSCHKGPLVGVPHKGHHLLICLSVCGSKLLICTVVCGIKCCMRIRPRSISRQLCPFPLWLCGWPLKHEAFLYWVQDLLTEPLLGCLFTLASSG